MLYLACSVATSTLYYYIRKNQSLNLTTQTKCASLSTTNDSYLDRAQPLVYHNVISIGDSVLMWLCTSGQCSWVK